MAAQLIGNRTTYQSFATENRVIRKVHDKIAMLEPNVAPLITLMMKLSKRKSTDNPVNEWQEQDYAARWAQSAATVANTTSATTIALQTNHGTYFVPGDTILVPAATASVGTYPELLRVTTVSSDTITVTRAFAGTTPVTIGSSGSLIILGSAFEEGASVPLAKMSSPTWNTTYTQIFRTATPPITYTAMGTKNYGSEAQGERARNQELKLKEHKIAMNRALLWGKASTTTGLATNNYVRTTQGIYSTISTNKFDANGILTMKALAGFMTSAFRYGPPEKVLLACPKMCEALDAWGNSHLQIRQSEKRFGVSVKEWVSSAGTLLVVRDWMLENGISGQNGMAGVSFILDLDQFTYLYLDGMEGYGDTKLYENVVRDGTHKMVDEYVTEGGFMIKNEKYHSMIYNMTDFSA